MMKIKASIVSIPMCEILSWWFVSSLEQKSAKNSRLCLSKLSGKKKALDITLSFCCRIAIITQNK